MENKKEIETQSMPSNLEAIAKGEIRAEKIYDSEVYIAEIKRRVL